MSTRERFLALRPKQVPVTVEGMEDCKLFVQSLTLGERAELLTQCMGESENSDDGEQTVDQGRLMPSLIIATLHDETGPVFSRTDLDAVKGLPASAMDVVWQASAKLNGFIEDETIEGNSVKPSDDSASS